MPKILRTLIFPLASLVIVVVLVATNAFSKQNLILTNILYDNKPASQDIIIVSIDDYSVQELGAFQTWDRAYLAEVIDNITSNTPQVIALDLALDTLSRNISIQTFQNLTTAEFNSIKSEFATPSDLQLAQSIANSPNLILAAIFNGKELTTAHWIFSKNSKKAVISSTRKDETLRSFRENFQLENGKIFDSFPVAIAKKFLDSPELSLPNKERHLINFHEPYQQISFSDVKNGNFPPETFTNKIVLVGVTSALEMHDQYFVPTSTTAPMPGVEIWANAIQTILDQDYLRYQSKTAQIITIFLLISLLSFILLYTNVLTSILVTIAAFILYYITAQLLFNQGVILNLVNPNIAILLTYIGSWVSKYLSADTQSKELKKAFKHYVSDELVEQIVKNPDMVKLGGDKRPVTVLFSDIESSTKISEKVEITAWVSQLNEYFTVMEEVIKQSGGTLDKFEGDAIMCFWNAPIKQENHVFRAYVAALTMKSKLTELHAKWQTQSKPCFNIRIGINSGHALVGNFGSKNQLNYTAMGDSINTASRLESAANKAYKTHLCVANFQEFIAKSDLEKLIFRELDTVILPGKTQPTKIYELLSLRSQLTETQKQQLQDYALGLAAYRAKNFPEALKHFQRLSEDGPAQVMAKRCETIIENNPVKGLDQNSMTFSIFQK